MPPRTVSVVVPTLNEEANVRRAVESARDDASSSSSAPPEVIVVDGGSVDNTVAEARKAGATVLASPGGAPFVEFFGGARAAKGAVLVSFTPTPSSPVSTAPTSTGRSGSPEGGTREWRAARLGADGRPSVEFFGDPDDGRGDDEPMLETRDIIRSRMFRLCPV